MRYLAILITVLLACMLVDEISKKKDIEARALDTPRKDCYTWQELEIIVFGEIQE